MKSERILKSILKALLIAATFNLAWQVGREAQAAAERERLYQEYEIIACKLGPSQDEAARLLIELGLVLAFFGLTLGRCFGKVASLSGTLFVVGVYAAWWKYYFTLMEVSEAGEDAVPHLFYLYAGVWLDLCIASCLPFVIVWQTCHAVYALTRPDGYREARG